MRKIFKFLFILNILIVSLILGLSANLLENQNVDFSVLENYSPGSPSVLLDINNQEWARFELDKREQVRYKNIPECLIQSFLASEDRDFFKHSGISLKGIFRSILVNLKSGRVVQGASTITQQLVKLLFLDSKRNFKRKIKEQFFSLLVEKQFTKEQILETYLNHVYFGCGIYGVAAACKRFFNKDISKIDYHEAAVLAGIVKSPANYCPLLNIKASKNRRDLILKLIKNLNYIDNKKLAYYLDQDLIIINNNKKILAPHLKESIRTWLENLVGKKDLYTGGLVVKTCLDINTQKIAELEFKKRFKDLKKELTSDIDGSLISLDPGTGEIRALIGGYDFDSSKFNRALQAKRQLGSVIKPIIYASALNKNISFCDLDIDEPVEIAFQGQSWKPRNNTRKFAGKMTLARALSYSNNIITIKTLLRAGLKDTAKLVKKFKFSDEVNPYPSLSLGCIDVTLKETVGAFNVFANSGIYVEPHYLKWVKNKWGQKIWKKKVLKERVLDLSVTNKVAKILSIGIKRFLRKLKNNIFKQESIGKTGTTNDSRTCWFAGSTANLTTAIYIGCDDNKSLGKNIYPVWTAFPIWLRLYEKLENKNLNKFILDPNLELVKINWLTGDIINNYNKYLHSNNEIVEIYK